MKALTSKRWLLPSMLAVISGTMINTAAYAELSLGFGAGLADYTVRVRGNALYAFGGGDTSTSYYQYPADYNSKNATANFYVRYLYPTCNTPFSAGIEWSYTYWHINNVTLRADDNFASNATTSALSVENFRTKSQGVVALNAVIRAMLTPTVSFNIFGGPAWLNTKYIDYDFHDDFRRATRSRYQLTGVTGVEADWQFCKDMLAGLRFDYFFQTDSRLISNYGSNHAPLLVKLRAKTRSTPMYSLNVRYSLPNF